MTLEQIEIAQLMERNIELTSKVDRYEQAITDYCLEYIEEIDLNDPECCINWFLAEYP